MLNHIRAAINVDESGEYRNSKREFPRRLLPWRTAGELLDQVTDLSRFAQASSPICSAVQTGVSNNL